MTAARTNPETPSPALTTTAVATPRPRPVARDRPTGAASAESAVRPPSDSTRSLGT
jgi:hypothetical protein